MFNATAENGRKTGVRKREREGAVKKRKEEKDKIKLFYLIVQPNIESGKNHHWT